MLQVILYFKSIAILISPNSMTTDTIWEALILGNAKHPVSFKSRFLYSQSSPEDNADGKEPNNNANPDTEVRSAELVQIEKLCDIFVERIL